MTKKVIKFGIIGCGLMGREFASAAARWCHLLESKARPELVAICDKNASLYPWYTNNFATITQVTDDYKALLENEEVEAIYCAVPHHLHEEMYIDIIAAGKHLLGEKPFGIDLEANRAIAKKVVENPDVMVRSSSEFPFYPGVQRIVEAVKSEDLGKIIEVEAGFLHSSDINPDKQINWKRKIESNGEYGCMGDLGLHMLHVPLRLGWEPKRVFAQLSNLMPTRPDGSGQSVPCETWDNATLHCDVETEKESFPMSLKTWRIAPGEMDTWYIKVLGTKKSYHFSTKNPRALEFMHYSNGESQCWQREDLGYDSVIPCITGGIFEFGFTDAILQMWAAFVDELAGGDASGFPCASVEETSKSHALFTAALKSHQNHSVEDVNYILYKNK